jgi:DNA polymerase/3'-5' exonuclease PolX
MSAGTKLPWATAAAIAAQLVHELRPVAARVKTVGSVRRRRSEVGDIEILIEPRTMTVGLFGEEGPDLDSIRDVASRWGRLTKNGPRAIQVEIPDGIHVDLFLCHPPAQWGSLLAIRTGPATLSTWAVTLMRERGLRHVGGHVEDDCGNLVATPQEEDFFAAAGLPCLPPRLRDSREALRPTDGRAHVQG